ncbi:MgPa adhesin [Mycoplasmoides genitalium M2288]|uniref:hypothetical protein n=1 Tax=Mycoplasmoides genitalium TaxID=2097 RepID=UPI00027B3794|nr:hypothetical protein [Mycoplasmoides genitalium]AFQ04511.1 MgPa adhesin [Mycoplasmoides genitalium M2288]
MPKVVVEYHQLDKKVVKESLGVDTSGSTLIPPKGWRKIVRWRIQQKQGRNSKQLLHPWVVVGLPLLARPSRLRWRKGSNVNQGELQSNDFAKKPLKHKENSGEVKLEAEKDFPEGKVWKPVLTTDQLSKNRGMGAT